MHVIVNSRKPKGKSLKDYIMNDIIPRGFNKLLEELQKEHQTALTDRENHIVAL